MQSVRLPGCRMWSATFHLDGLCRQTQSIVLGSTHIVEGCIVDVGDSGCNEQGGGGYYRFLLVCLVLLQSS